MASYIGQELGNYRCLRLIGQGSFANVYLGVHTQLGYQVAIKVLRTQVTNADVPDFLNEARIVARLNHPNIVHILDFGVEQQIPFLVMTYAPNGSLRQRHPVGSILPLTQIVFYIKQLASALQHAHEQRLMHRDVKPENILLGRDGELLLSDFGIALIAQSTQLQGLQTIAGTVAYMAPEQLQGKPRLESDQYALGIMAYEWLTGNRPFHGTFSEMASQHIFVLPPSLREKLPALSPVVEEVVLTALAKDPKKRFASVKAFANALEQAAFADSAFLSTSTKFSPSATLPSLSTLPPTQQQPSSNPAVENRLEQEPLPVQQQTRAVHTSVPSIYQSTGIPDTGYSHVQRKSGMGRNLSLIALTMLMVIATFTLSPVLGLFKKSPPPPNGIVVTQLAGGEVIGISDGSFAFDTKRPDGSLKRQGSDKFKEGNITAAKTSWQAAISQESNDAEALIYLENQRVQSSHHPYLTLIVGTVLTGGSVSVGRDDLQGAYVAQKEFNTSSNSPNSVMVRLLVANSGSEARYATRIAQQIVQAAQVDKTIIGVMGWPFSGSSKLAIAVLTAAHIPLVSPAASYDYLTGISPYFFRVVPSDSRQVFVITRYAEQVLHAKKAALFLDPGGTYSNNWASDFQQQFLNDGNSIVNTENYTVGHPETLRRLLQKALQANPDLIYFSGDAHDAAILLSYLPTSGRFANLQVIGGDALYGNGSYPRNASNGFNRLHFPAVAIPNEWDALGLGTKKPLFFTEYGQDFDPRMLHKGNPFGYTSADNVVIFSYDATLALLTGSKIVLGGGKKGLTSTELQQGLLKLTGSQAIQGTSGQISFGADGNPIDKAVVVLKLNLRGDFTPQKVDGMFLMVN